MEFSSEAAGVMEIIRLAGDQARALQDNPQSQRKADGTPVSAGDLKANDVIVDWLQQQYPDDAILSEELSDDGSRHRAQRLWIIDPIDGTSAFIDGRHDWAVQIALAVDNKLKLGALYFPGSDRAYLGVPGQGAWLVHASGERQAISVPEQPQQILLCSRSARNAIAMQQARKILHEFDHVSVSSVGVKVDYMLRDQGSLYVNPSRIAEWDYAGPAAVLLAAGGFVSDFNQQMLPINSTTVHCEGIIFSSHREHEQLVKRLQEMRT